MPVPDARGGPPYKPMAARITWTPFARPPLRGFAAGGAVAVAVVALAFVPTRLDGLASPGPLARAHQQWENDCAQCHAPLSGVASAAGSARCATCHDEPEHHPSAVGAPACAECHVDHQGRGGLLTRPADAACTRCHADLAAHHRHPDSITVAPRIRGFGDAADGHPEFRLVAAPAPRRFQFSHAAHVGPKAGAGLPLTCAACHTPDGGPAAGRHHLPVTYEAHCRRCHPLPFDNDLTGVEAPHGVQPDGLAEFLGRVYADRWVRGTLTGAPFRGAGSERLDPFWPALPAVAEATVGEAIAGRVEAARRRLFEGGRACLKCHTATVEPPVAAVPSRVHPAGLHTVLLPRAAFSHAAHRNEACGRCHAAANTSRTRDEERAAATNRAGGMADAPFQHAPDVPGIADCRTCHGDAGRAVRGCADCHTYHGAAGPRPGVTPRRPGAARPGNARP